MRIAPYFYSLCALGLDMTELDDLISISKCDVIGSMARRSFLSIYNDGQLCRDYLLVEDHHIHSASIPTILEQWLCLLATIYRNQRIQPIF